MGNTAIEQMLLKVLEAKVVEIRDVDEGEEPFFYTSGNRGPGYVSIKDLVGRKEIIKLLSLELAKKITKEVPKIDFVAGSASGGLIPGWLLSECLEEFLGKRVPFVYIREQEKEQDQRGLITGISNNPEIISGYNALVVDEVINFAKTACKSVEFLRKAGYAVTHAACILFYNNSEALKTLKGAKIEIIYLFTLDQLLEAAEKQKMFPKRAIDSYREFLKNPLVWQTKRGLRKIT